MMQPIRTYLLHEKDAKKIRPGAKLELTIPLHRTKISPNTLKSLDGNIEEFLMEKLGNLPIKLLSGHKTIAEGKVTGASTNRYTIRLDYKITEVYRK